MNKNVHKCLKVNECVRTSYIQKLFFAMGMERRKNQIYTNLVGLEELRRNAIVGDGPGHEVAEDGRRVRGVQDEVLNENSPLHRGI